MSAYEIPRNVKGESRILYIFTIKALIYTCVGGGVGLIFYFIIGRILGLTWVGIITAIIFATIGYGIAMIKIPDSNSTELTRKAGGEQIDEIILRLIKYKKKGKRIYLYTKEESK